MDLIAHEVPLDSSFLKDRANLVSRSSIACRRRPSRYVNKSSRIEPRLKAARHIISLNTGDNSWALNPRERRRRRTVSDTVATDRRSPDSDKPSKKSAVLIQTWERRSQTENGKPEILCNGNSPNRTDIVNGHLVNDLAKMPGRPASNNNGGTCQTKTTTNFNYTCCNGSAKPQGFLKGKSTKQDFNTKPLTRPRSLHNLSNTSSNEEPEWISLSRKLCAKFIQSHLDKDSNDVVVSESRENVSQAIPASRASKQIQGMENVKRNFRIPVVENNKQQQQHQKHQNGDVPQWVNLSKKLCTKFIEEHIECEPCNEDAKQISLPKNSLDLEKSSDIRIIEKIGKRDDDKIKQKSEELPEWVTLSRRLRAKFIEGHKDDPDTISLDNQLNASDLEDYLDSKYRRENVKDDEGRKYVLKKDEFQRTPNNGTNDYRNFVNGNGRVGTSNYNGNGDGLNKKYCYWSDIAPRERNIKLHSPTPNGHDYTRDMTPRTRRFFEDEDDVSYELTFETFETEDSVSQDSGTVSGRSSENEPYGGRQHRNAEQDLPLPLKDAKMKSKSMGDLIRCHEDDSDSVYSCSQIDGCCDSNSSKESKHGTVYDPPRTENASKQNGNGLSLWRNFCEASTNTTDSLDVKFHDSVYNDVNANKRSTAVGTDHSLSSYADTVRIKVDGPFSNGTITSSKEELNWDTIESSTNNKHSRHSSEKTQNFATSSSTDNDNIAAENGNGVSSNHKQFDERNGTQKQREWNGGIDKVASEKLHKKFGTNATRTENHNGEMRPPMVIPKQCKEAPKDKFDKNILITAVIASCTGKDHDGYTSAFTPKKEGRIINDKESLKAKHQSFSSKIEKSRSDKSNTSKSIEISSVQSNDVGHLALSKDSINGVNDLTENLSICPERKVDELRPDSPIYESMYPIADIGNEPHSYISDDSLTYESIPQTTVNKANPENSQHNGELSNIRKNCEQIRKTLDSREDKIRDIKTSCVDTNGFHERKYGTEADVRVERVVASRNKEFTVRKVYEDIDDRKPSSITEKTNLNQSVEHEDSKNNHYYDEVSVEPTFSKDTDRNKERANSHGAKPKEEKFSSRRIENNAGHLVSSDDNDNNNNKSKKHTSKVMSYTSISSNHVTHRKENLRSVELPESNCSSNSSRRSVISGKDEKKRSKTNDKFSSYQPINSPFEFETFEIPSLCSPENKSILQKHEAELIRSNGCGSVDECREIRRYESSDSETPGSSPFDVRTLFSPSSCASDSEVSSWTLTQNNSCGGKNSPGNAETDFSDCSMSVKCDCNPECSSEQNTMENRGISAQQRRKKKENDQESEKKLDPRTRFSEIFVDCETSKNWKKSRSLDHLEEKSSSPSSNFYVNIDEDGSTTKNLSKSTDNMEAMPESLRHIFNLPMNPIYTPSAKTNMLLSRTAEPPRSHYYSVATPALSSSSFKQQAPSKPKKSERSSSLKIKDIAQGIILTFRKFHSHSKSSNLSTGVDVSHLAETNGSQQKECSEIHQRMLMRNTATDYGNMNGRMLSAGYFGSRSTSESNLYMPPDSKLLSCPGKVPKKSKEDGRPLSFNFGKIPDGKKSKTSKKTPEMKEKKAKNPQGKTKHKSSSGEGTVSSVSRKIQQMADGTFCLVTTVSGGTTLPGVYSDSNETASESGAPRARQLGESNC